MSFWLKLYLQGKTVHRFCVIFIIVLGLVMMITGSIMKYPSLFPFVDEIVARQFHNLLSPAFAIIFSVMLITGTYMFIFPHLPKPTPPPKQSN